MDFIQLFYNLHSNNITYVLIISFHQVRQAGLRSSMDHRWPPGRSLPILFTKLKKTKGNTLLRSPACVCGSLTFHAAVILLLTCSHTFVTRRNVIFTCHILTMTPTLTWRGTQRASVSAVFHLGAEHVSDSEAQTSVSKARIAFNSTTGGNMGHKQRQKWEQKKKTQLDCVQNVWFV